MSKFSQQSNMSFRKNAAMNELMVAAVEMGHPVELAIELYKYLSLRLRSPASEQLSPSTSIDQLWH